MGLTLKEEAQKFLANVPEEYAFWCRDGRILRNLSELRDALDSMTDESFVHHSNAEKQDFSNWVRDVIGDERLAKDLGKATNRARAAKLVASRISILSRRLA